MDGPIQLDVNIDSMIVCVSLFSCSFPVRMYHCTAFSAVFDWICALQLLFFHSEKLKKKLQSPPPGKGYNTIDGKHSCWFTFCNISWGQALNDIICHTERVQADLTE